MPPGDDAGPITPQIATRLCQSLLRFGTIAFRADSPVAGGVFTPEPANPLWRRLCEAVVPTAAGATFGIITTDDLGVAATLFTWEGWRIGLQAALVFDRDADPGPIVGALRHGMDWRHRVFPPGSHLLLGSGHDGGFAVVSARTDGVLDQFIATLPGTP